jgi:thiol-disulfide isomerase/thioredoxin
VVNFFASWCPHCSPELPALADISRRPGAGVDVLGVDSNDPNSSAARAMLAAAQATYPVVVDPKAQVSTQYLLTALPATYFVGRDGRVLGAVFGPQTAAQLAGWVARLTTPPAGG